MAPEIFPVARRPASDELQRVGELLEDASLPALPFDIPLANVVVATRDDEIVGAIALEVIGRYGLLRSSVVDPAHRRTRVGTRLVQSILARASELGLREVFLLTESAADFFARHRFRKVPRERVPDEIRATREYAEQCSDTAELMRLRLDSRL